MRPIAAHELRAGANESVQIDRESGKIVLIDPDVTDV